MSKCIVAITSRWLSTRFQGKALAHIKGKPLLRHIVDRARQSRVDDVIVATTLLSQPILKYCSQEDINYYAHPNDWDILGRLLNLAESNKADTIVYLWGDCPFIDPKKIDAGLDYFNISHTYFFDMSQPMAIMDIDFLRKLDKLDLTKHHREWIHDYIMKNILKPVMEINTKEDIKRANELL